jgi:hypothetical protein
MIIGIPTMGTIPIKVFASVVKVVRIYGDELKIMTTANSLVYNARNDIALDALNNGTDLFFLDSDIEFTTEAFKRLLSHKKPIVAGLYWQRSSPSLPVAYKKVRPKTLFRDTPVAEHITDIEPFMEVEGAGLGFCLIRHEVLKAVSKDCDNPFQPFGNMGEDFSFFYRCRKKGYKVYLDTTLKLKHLGEYEYGRE